MIRICIDIRAVQAPNKTGVFVYTQKMVEALGKIDNSSTYYLLATGIRVKPENIPLHTPGNFHKKIIRIPDRNFRGKKWLWNNVIIPTICRLTKSKIFWQPTGHQIPKTSSIKKVITIHDLRALHIDDFLPQDIEGLKKAVKTADIIVAISNFTKYDIINNLNAPEDKIIVIHNGVEQSPYMPTEEEKQNFLSLNKIDKPFFFCLGMVPRKNVVRTIEAFANSNIKKESILVFAGSHGGFLNKYKEIASKLGVLSHIKFFENISELEISILYSSAIAFVFPSLFEGFGLPILEAQSYGCPVISSNLSAIPEVTNDSAILVNPYSVEDIQTAMEKLFFDESLRKSLSNKGKENIKRFQWKNSAKKLLSLFQSLST